jgi:hypothetical protein
VWCTELPYDGDLPGLHNLDDTHYLINPEDDDNDKGLHTCDEFDKLGKIVVKPEEGMPIKPEDDLLDTLMDVAREQPGVLDQLYDYPSPPLHTGEAPGQDSRS